MRRAWDLIRALRLLLAMCQTSYLPRSLQRVTQKTPLHAVCLPADQVPTTGDQSDCLRRWRPHVLSLLWIRGGSVGHGAHYLCRYCAVHATFEGLIRSRIVRDTALHQYQYCQYRTPCFRLRGEKASVI